MLKEVAVIYLTHLSGGNHKIAKSLRRFELGTLEYQSRVGGPKSLRLKATSMVVR